MDNIPTELSISCEVVITSSPFQPLAENTCLDPAGPLTANLKFNPVGCVDEDPISTRTYPKRNILVCLITRGSAIRIP